MNLEALVIKALEAVNRDDKETVYCRVRDMAIFLGLGLDNTIPERVVDVDTLERKLRTLYNDYEDL